MAAIADRFAGLREEFEAEDESRTLYRVQVRQVFAHRYMWLSMLETPELRAAENYAQQFADESGHMTRIVAIQAVTARWFAPGPAKQD